MCFWNLGDFGVAEAHCFARYKPLIVADIARKIFFGISKKQRCASWLCLEADTDRIRNNTERDEDEYAVICDFSSLQEK